MKAEETFFLNNKVSKIMCFITAIAHIYYISLKFNDKKFEI